MPLALFANKSIHKLVPWAMSSQEGRLVGVEDWPAPLGAIKAMWYRGSRYFQVSLLNPGSFLAAHGCQPKKCRNFLPALSVEQGLGDALPSLGLITPPTVVDFTAHREKSAKPFVDGMAFTSTASALCAISGINK